MNQNTLRSLRHPTLLFLDHSHTVFYEIPWDAFSTLQRDNITLGIDLEVCQNLYTTWTQKSFPRFDPRSAKKIFVINPLGDIPDTEKAIPSFWLPENSRNKTDTKQNLYYIKTIPHPENLLYHLCQSHLYVYCGHGGGSQFLSPETIQIGYRSLNDTQHEFKHSSIQSLIFLMGCSSVKFEKAHNKQGAQVNSLALDFLIGGAPTIIGLLWDVIDLDLDRFTHHYLRSWCDCWEKYGNSTLSTKFWWGTLAHAKRQAKRPCYLKCLTGSSCVQVGLPL